MNVRPIVPSDRTWMAPLFRDAWGAEHIVSRGVVNQPLDLPGFVAHDDGTPLGVITYLVTGDSCEIVTLNSLVEGKGVGNALLQAVVDAVQGCRRIWLITTNDNVNALRFYQTHGFVLAALYPGAIAESRRIKPEIPTIGNFGIPIRDEIELEYAGIAPP